MPRLRCKALIAHSLFCAVALVLSCFSGCRPGAKASAGDREIWAIYTMGGTRVGYDRVVIRHATGAAGPIVRIEGLSHLKFRRASDEVELDVKYSTRETPQGRLLDFSLDVAQGAASTLAVTGRVQDHELRIEVGAGGKMTAAAIPWSDDYGGLFAEDESLAARPLQPGEKRTLRAFVPDVQSAWHDRAHGPAVRKGEVAPVCRQPAASGRGAAAADR